VTVCRDALQQALQQHLREKEEEMAAAQDREQEMAARGTPPNPSPGRKWPATPGSHVSGGKSEG
jgi:hypothetical protein